MIVICLFAQARALAANQGAGTVMYLESLRPMPTVTSVAAKAQKRIVMLRAAARLSPQLTMIYPELARTAIAVGRPDLAEWADRALLSRTPEHVLAQLRTIDLELNKLQTVEAKQNYLRQIVNQNARNQANLRPEVASDVWRRLAELAWQNYDRKLASRNLERAIQHARQNLRAQHLYTELVWSDPAGSLARRYQRRAEMLLGTVMADPQNLVPYHQLAVLAGKCGFADTFKFWRDAFARVRDISPGFALTIADKLDLGDAALAAGAYSQARQILSELLDSPPAATAGLTITEVQEARIRVGLAILAQKLGDKSLLAYQQEWFELNFNKFLEGKLVNGDVAAIVSIYHAVYGLDLARATTKAVKLASFAYKSAKPPSDTAILALALAHAKAGQSARTHKLIGDLSEPTEPLAVLAAAWAQLAEDKREQAGETLRNALENTGPGPVRDELIKLSRGVVSKPPAPNFKKVKRTFETFPAEYIRLPFELEKFCRLQIRTHGDLSKGEFVRIELCLTNLGPLELTVGPDSLIAPYAAVFIRVEVAGKQETFLIELPLDEKQILKPGQGLTAHALIDQAYAIDDSYNSLDKLIAAGGPIKKIEVFASLDEAALKSNTIELAPPRVDEEFIRSLSRELAAPKSIDFRWARRAGWVLRNPRLKREAKSLVSQIITAINASGPNGSAALAFVLRYAPPDSAVQSALAASLSHPNWLCRFVALDSITTLRGDRLRHVYEHIAKNDSDASVRRLAVANLLNAPNKKVKK